MTIPWPIAAGICSNSASISRNFIAAGSVSRAKKAAALSTRQRNAASSVSAGVLKSRVGQPQTACGPTGSHATPSALGQVGGS